MQASSRRHKLIAHEPVPTMTHLLVSADRPEACRADVHSLEQDSDAT